MNRNHKRRRFTRSAAAEGLNRWKAAFVAGALAILGIVGYIYLQTKTGIDPVPKPWWYVLLNELSDTLMDVGILGLLFELLFRRELFSEFQSRMKRLFSEDREMAESLSTEVRKDRVLSTLKAQLDEELGEAIFDTLIKRYFSEEEYLSSRWNYNAEVSFEDLDTDEIKLDAGNGAAPEAGEGDSEVSLQREEYYRLKLSARYEGHFSQLQNCVGLILVNDQRELNYWFSCKDCYFRDVLLLNSNDRDQLVKVFRSIPGDSPAGEEIEKLISSFLKIEVKINGQVLPIAKYSFSPSHHSIRLEFKEDELKKIPQGTRVKHEINLESVISKTEKTYPYILKVPCKNPRIRLNYASATGISHIVPAVFFSGEADDTYQLSIQGKSKYVEVSTPYGEEVWVFPNSGVLFTWP